uniref:Ac45-VOA1_TM domain-containing protein n=1 Tax=Strongyloides papillosus TaxID=174720 RepID=A0A0N5C3U5_STREA
MKLLVSLLFLVASTFAKDAIIWSNKDISQTSLLSLTESDDITIFALSGFTLAEFSKKAGVYSNNPESSGIIKNIKDVEYKQESLPSPLEVSDNTNIIEVSTWDELEKKFEKFIAEIGRNSFTAAIVDGNYVEKNSVRSKRAAASTPAPITGEVNGKGPVIAPTDSSTNASCLFYLEGLSLIYFEHSGKTPYKATFLDFTNSSDPYTVKYACNGMQGDSTFDVTVKTKGIQMDKDQVSIGSQDITFRIKVSPVGYYTWAITEFTIVKAEVTVDGNKHSVTNSTNTAQAGIKFLDAYMYSDYGYACSQTSAVFAPSDGENKIGMTLNGFQIQMIGPKTDGKNFYGFVHNMNDCVPTFSVGSWMSIISALILASVLLFGFLMLNSVQTMDRFDDPKAKQIVINFKE